MKVWFYLKLLFYAIKPHFFGLVKKYLYIRKELLQKQNVKQSFLF